MVNKNSEWNSLHYQQVWVLDIIQYSQKNASKKDFWKYKTTVFSSQLYEFYFTFSEYNFVLDKYNF